MHRRIKLIAAKEQLPVWTARKALLQHIKENDCLVVVGETGSGKTTQIPQLLLKAGLAEQGCIACTQPRRVAAITVAARVAQEYPCHLGQEASQTLRCYAVCVSQDPRNIMTKALLINRWATLSASMTNLVPAPEFGT